MSRWLWRNLFGEVNKKIYVSTPTRIICKYLPMYVYPSIIICAYNCNDPIRRDVFHTKVLSDVPYFWRSTVEEKSKFSKDLRIYNDMVHVLAPAYRPHNFFLFRTAGLSNTMNFIALLTLRSCVREIRCVYVRAQYRASGTDLAGCFFFLIFAVKVDPVL